MRTDYNCVLIDNDVEDQEVFEMALNDANEQVMCIPMSSVTEAIERFNKNPDLIPLFICIDMNMPLMDGKECLLEIKKMQQLDHVPVFIFSTFADDNTIAEVKRIGAKDFIKKPNNYKALVDVLSNILQSLNISYVNNER